MIILICSAICIVSNVITVALIQRQSVSVVTLPALQSSSSVPTTAQGGLHTVCQQICRLLLSSQKVQALSIRYGKKGLYSMTSRVSDD